MYHKGFNWTFTPKSFSSFEKHETWRDEAETDNMPKVKGEMVHLAILRKLEGFSTIIATKSPIATHWSVSLTGRKSTMKVLCMTTSSARSKLLVVWIVVHLFVKLILDALLIT